MAWRLLHMPRLTCCTTRQTTTAKRLNTDFKRGSKRAQVVYGDTDSIMVHTGTDDLAAARALGAAIKREVRGLLCVCICLCVCACVCVCGWAAPPALNLLLAAQRNISRSAPKPLFSTPLPPPR